MSQVLSIAAPVVLALLAGGAVFFVWVSTRRRIAAETIGRAEQDAARILRDAEAQQKELILAGREEAHGLLRDAERQARQRQDEIASLETTADSRKRALAEQAAAMEKREQDVAGGELWREVAEQLVNGACAEAGREPGERVGDDGDAALAPDRGNGVGRGSQHRDGIIQPKAEDMAAARGDFGADDHVHGRARALGCLPRGEADPRVPRGE